MILCLRLCPVLYEQVHGVVSHIRSKDLSPASHALDVYLLGLRVNPLRPVHMLATMALKGQRTRVLPLSHITRSP